MSITSELSKLLTNKYFLYFIVFLAASNVIGYLVTNKLNAVIFFGLVGLLTHHFSKNMAVVLLVSIVATNFLISNKRLMEGLENQEPNALKKAKDTDPEIAKVVPAVKNSKSVDEAKAKLSNEKNAIKTAIEEESGGDGNIVDINNDDLNKKKEEANVPEGVGEKITNKKTKTNENFGPRLDYAATIEQSYQNLDELLGTDSIKQLTTDTQKLMAQQQNLFNTMNQMVPVLEGAQNMLKGFNVDGISKSLKQIRGVADAPTVSNVPTVRKDPTVRNDPTVRDAPALRNAPAVRNFPTVRNFPNVGK